jgi:hypothetical protein
MFRFVMFFTVLMSINSGSAFAFNLAHSSSTAFAINTITEKLEVNPLEAEMLVLEASEADVAKEYGAYMICGKGKGGLLLWSLQIMTCFVQDLRSGSVDWYFGHAGSIGTIINTGANSYQVFPSGVLGATLLYVRGSDYRGLKSIPGYFRGFSVGGSVGYGVEAFYYKKCVFGKNCDPFVDSGKLLPTDVIPNIFIVGGSALMGGHSSLALVELVKFVTAKELAIELLKLKFSWKWY